MIPDCINCNRELEAHYNFCPDCGTPVSAQATRTPRTLYNVFYRGIRSYEMVWSRTIPTLEGMIALIPETFFRDDREYFVAHYIEGSGVEHNSGESYPLLSWRKIKNGQLEDDEGARTVFVSYLE